MFVVALHGLHLAEIRRQDADAAVGFAWYHPFTP